VACKWWLGSRSRWWSEKGVNDGDGRYRVTNHKIVLFGMNFVPYNARDDGKWKRAHCNIIAKTYHTLIVKICIYMLTSYIQGIIRSDSSNVAESSNHSLLPQHCPFASTT
jgi:hypothetical protein